MRGRASLRWWLCQFASPAIAAALGSLVDGSWNGVGAAFAANIRLQAWQLGAVFSTDGGWWTTALGFHAPRWAVVGDLALIGCYGYVLAGPAARAIAHAAEFDLGGRTTQRVLIVLGWALPVALIGDLAENGFTWLTLTAGQAGVWWLADVLRAGMALGAAAKFSGLAGVLALIVGWRALRPR